MQAWADEMTWGFVWNRLQFFNEERYIFQAAS
jgi:hypothetical protein